MDIKKVKKILIPFLLPFLFIGCATIAGLERGVTKPWVEIVSKRKNLKGKVYDVCYRLDLSFSSNEAKDSLDTYENCIDSCCWHSEKKQVVLDFNKNFEKNLKTYGVSHKFNPSKVTIDIHRTSLIHFITAKAAPAIVEKDGYIKVKHKVVVDDKRIMEIDREQKLKEQMQAKKTKYPVKAKKAPARKKYPKRFSASGESYALALVKEKVSKKIDDIHYQTKKYAKTNNLALEIERETWITNQISENKYKVTCIIHAKVGKTAYNLKERWISCGTWQTDVKKFTVTPLDNTAKKMLKR